MLGESYAEYIFDEFGEEEEGGEEGKRRTLPKLDTDILLRSSLGYTLTITVISSSPIPINVLPALKKHLLPTVQAISHLADIKVDVQLKPYSSLSFEPERDPDDPGKFIITKEQQSIFVNGEWNIHNTISQHPQVQTKCNITFIIFPL